MAEIKKVYVNTAGLIVPKSPKLPLDIPNKAPSGVRSIKVTLDAPAQRIKETRPNGHWEFPDQLGGKYFGFIYLIHDTLANKMYIGKKQFKGTGKENKGQDTDWRRYTSSSKELNARIKEHGREKFGFYVLEQYQIRGTLGYAETWSLMYVEALVHRHKWYNGLVNKVSWTVKESVSERHKERLNTLRKQLDEKIH